MKTIHLLLIIFFVSLYLPSFSQKVTRKVTKEICHCFDKIDLKAPSEDVHEKAQGCILSGIMEHAEELVEEYNIDPDDEAAGEKVGRELGKRLMEHCPSAVKVFTLMGASGEQGEQPEEEGKQEGKKK